MLLLRSTAACRFWLSTRSAASLFCSSRNPRDGVTGAMATAARGLCVGAGADADMPVCVTGVASHADVDEEDDVDDAANDRLDGLDVLVERGTAVDVRVGPGVWA